MKISDCILSIHFLLPILTADLVYNRPGSDVSVHRGDFSSAPNVSFKPAAYCKTTADGVGLSPRLPHFQKNLQTTEPPGHQRTLTKTLRLKLCSRWTLDARGGGSRLQSPVSMGKMSTVINQSKSSNTSAWSGNHCVIQNKSCVRSAHRACRTASPLQSSVSQPRITFSSIIHCLTYKTQSLQLVIDK